MKVYCMLSSLMVFYFPFQLRFQHDVYPEEALQSSRQVILIHDVEIRDRLASSNINKFLYAYSSKARPRQSHAHMVRSNPTLYIQLNRITILIIGE